MRERFRYRSFKLNDKYIICACPLEQHTETASWGAAAGCSKVGCLLNTTVTHVQYLFSFCNLHIIAQWNPSNLLYTLWHLWFTFWLCSAKPDAVRDMWDVEENRERKAEGGEREWLLMLGLFYKYSSPICRRHPHVCQTQLFVLSLSLWANKLIYNTAKEKQTENCQHRWSFEEGQMIKSVRFNNNLTTSVLILSPSLLVDGRKGKKNSKH